MILEIKELYKSYGSKKAIHNFSLRLNEGVYGLLGPNGAGKSTLMNIITDNLRFDRGSILLDNRDIFKMGKAYRKLFGYMPQQPCLYDSFTAERYLGYMAALRGMEKRAAKERIDLLLEMVHLSDVRHKRLGGFSGGMKQRIMIAQALLDDPALLILDEPTAGLDPRERIRIRNLISKLSKDKIVILATHVVTDVEFISKEIVVMKQGELLYQAPAAELQARLMGKVFEIKAQDEEIQSLMKAYKISNVLRQDNGVILRAISDEEPTQCTFEPVQPTLEDVYLYEFDDEIVSE